MDGVQNTGFLTLSRGIATHWIWDDSNALKWWLDLLLKANYEEKKIFIKGVLITCKRGQCAYSLETLSKEWRVDKSKVRRFLELLKSDSMISTENVKVTTLITICNYDVYNKSRNADDTTTKQKRNVDETLTTPTKEVKKLISKEISKSASPPSFKNFTELDFRADIVKNKKDYSQEMLKEFFNYWKEKTPGGKMLFQLKKTWETNLRLATWSQRDFNKNSGEKAPVLSITEADRIQQQAKEDLLKNITNGKN